MPEKRSRIFFIFIGTAWAALVLFGLSLVWKYESTAEAAANPPITWPAGTSVDRSAELPTLVLLFHPQCPCSQATVAELARLMTECSGKLTATVVMLRPEGFSDGWEKTSLWDSAAAIPGVSVVSDPAGEETRRFGAATSGQALLYSTSGKLLFAGGITESRGHQGDNAGRSAIAALVLDKASVTEPALTPVYGCPLFDKSSNHSSEGTLACHSK